MPNSAVKAVDWPSIRADYEEGLLALPDIAEAHGITEAKIRERAEREAWPRLTMDVMGLGLRGATVMERLLGISTTRFHDLRQEEVITEAAPGKYNPLTVIRAVIRHFMAAAAGRTPGKLEALKIEFEAEKVAALRQKRERDAGKLVPAADFEATLKAVFRYIHDEFTDRSAKIAHALADEYEPGTIKLALERHDREALERVAERIADTLDDFERARDLTPDPAPRSLGVGRPPSKAAALE